MVLKYVLSHGSGKLTAGNHANNEPQSNPLRRGSSALPYSVAKEGASMSPSALSPVLMPIPLDSLTPADARKRVAAARVLCRGLFQGRDVTNPSADGHEKLAVPTNCVCTERNRLGGAGKKRGSQRPRAILGREIHAAQEVSEAGSTDGEQAWAGGTHAGAPLMAKQSVPRAACCAILRVALSPHRQGFIWVRKGEF